MRLYLAGAFVSALLYVSCVETSSLMEELRAAEGELRCKGVDNGCCTSDKPCKENDGDCDSNSHCEEGLYCGNDNCDWGDGDDCCFSVGAEYKKKILNAITSTITNPPLTRDTTSQRSKLLQRLPNVMKDYYYYVGTDIFKDDLYEDVFKDLFLKIVANPELEDHFPHFTSAFQITLLPTAIQKEDLNSPLLKSKLKTPFPKAVEDSADLEVKEVTINGTYVDKCAFHDCTFGRKWISTDLYAKQGQLVTVTVPEHVAGKFAIRVGSHTDQIWTKNQKAWLKGKKFYRPYSITQYYGKELIKEKTRLLTPYGGLIYIDIYAPIELGTFTLKFENVITSPRFKEGETTKKEWSEMLASKSPMVELDVPDVIITIPRSYIDKESINMEHLSSEFTKIMKAFRKMQGFKMPRPHRYVFDVELTAGAAHAGYPIVDASFYGEIKQLANGDENNVYDTVWAMTHEIGHMVQQDMWNPSGLGETTNDIFSQYINEIVLDSNPKNQPNLGWVVDFKENGKKFSDLENKGKLNIFSMVKQECSWDTYKKFFKYYNEEIPKSKIPKTKAKRYSTIAKVLSEKCNKNLIPFFKWWNWPSITAETEEATKNLPLWDGIIDILNSANKTAVLRRCDGINNGCCTDENPCEENDGDCDDDNECLGDLVCGTDNCAWGGGDDCCKAPAGSISSPGCKIFKKDSDVDYYGSVLGSKITSSEKECAEFCSSNKRCEVWSIRKSDGRCWIKNGNPYRIRRAGFIAGTKQCGAEEKDGCLTDSGACIFPFTYDGKTYNACTDADYSRKWCATKEDQTGSWWDSCPSTC